MANLKTLLKDSAVYGMSSIVGKFLNYLLVPLYTAQMSAESGGYGVITNIYSWVALLMIVLTFGMETTMFHFAGKREDPVEKIFSTALIFVGSLATLFVVFVLLFIDPVAAFFHYADTPQYIWVMALIVGIDAVRALPFAYMRQQKQAWRFATLQLVNIGVSILLNIIYYKGFNGTDPGYAFYINLVCSAVMLLCVWRELSLVRHGVSLRLLRPMVRYAWPVMLMGAAGILNQVADKILFPFIYEGSDQMEQLSIYGAVAKIAMIMAMILQAFRYAYEPFILGKTRDKDNDETQAQTMKFYVIFTLLAFLCVVGWLDVLKYFLRQPEYWQGLFVVPIIMAAEIMYGIYFNLSIWYKQSGKTIWGVVFAAAGCVVLLAVNVIFVPRYGYEACAWGGVAGYGTAMLTSYVVGQRVHPIAYPLRDIFVYVLATAILFAAMHYSQPHLPQWASLGVNTLLIVLFLTVIVKRDMPLSSLPYIGKYFK
jgi:O-antigen/teichoic acid export membrane protein